MGILSANGAPASKQFKYVPIYTNHFFSGLFTNRSPFNGPDGRYYAKFLGGRQDLLIDGSNVEVSTIGTIQRRPGFSSYSSATLSGIPQSFYSFRQINNSVNPIILLADTTTNVYNLTSTSATSILTKAGGAGQAYFQGVANTLYGGDGVDLFAWPGTGNTRNWGIAMSNPSDTTGPNAVGTGSDVAVAGGGAWANPGNITTNDGVFSTVTITASAGGTFTAGPTLPTVAATAGAGTNWNNPVNITVNDGATATSSLGGNTSKEIQGTGFGFSIPSNAVILGIQVDINRKANFANEVQDNDVTLLKAGVATGSNKATATFWPTTLTKTTYGGSADLWGTTWVASDINNANFGVQLSATNTNGLNLNGTAAVDYVQITVTYSQSSGTAVTDYLEGTNFGFAFATANTISGILVEIKGLQGAGNPVASGLSVSMMKNGTLVGTAKTSQQLGTSNAFISLGGSNDLWGTTWSSTDLNSATFGIAIQGSNSSTTSASWSIDFVRITVYGNGGPTISVAAGAGTFSAVTGYQYVYAYGNSTSGHISNPTPASASTGVFSNKLNVSVSLTASSDTQVDSIHVYRTKDGGSVYFELPTSPYANTTANITDNAADANLQLLTFWPSIPTLSNSTPPAGLVKLAYHAGRVWGAVNNIVYYSSGPDVSLGNGNEAWPPANFFIFPSQVNRLVPISSGLLVFTASDVYAIVGTGTTTFYAQIFQEGVGLLSYNALDVQGSNMFVYAADKQFLQVSSQGINNLGYAIGDQLETNYSPSSVYVTSLISGSRDQGVYIADGAANWFRCNWNQPPEGGPCWSPEATISGGLSCAVSVETSPGIHQLLIGQTNGKVLARNTSVFDDNGNTFTSFATIGSLVLAEPGQLADVRSITAELQNVGSLPTVGVLIEEISGTFETLSAYTDDPPYLTPPASLLSKRWYLNQQPNPLLMRHCQIKLAWPSESAKNELLSLSVLGALHYNE